MFNFLSQSYQNNPIRAIASRVDQFAKQPTFRILQEEKYHTSCGIITTISLITICLVYLVTEFDNLLSYSDPSILISEELLRNDEELYLTNNNFTFAVVLADYTYQPMDDQDKYFFIVLGNCHRQTILNETSGKLEISEKCTQYKMENCALNHHFVTKEQLSFFANYNLTNVLCPNSEQWKNRPLKLQGNIYGKHFQYLRLFIDKCRNSTNSQCETEENIDLKLSSGLYGLFLNDALIKMEQPGNPYQDNMELIYESISPSDSKILTQGYKKIDTFTDNGYFSQNLQFDPKIVLGQKQITQQYYNDRFILSHIIQLDSKKNVYRRQYIRVQTILGTIGGLWNFFHFLFTLILSQVIRKLMTISIAETLFNFEQNEIQKDEIIVEPKKDFIKYSNNIEDKEDIQKQQKDLENFVFDKQIKSSIWSRIKKKSNLKQTISKSTSDQLSTNKDLQLFLKQRKKKLNLGILQYFQLIFCCKKLLRKQLDYASNKITQKMDIVYLLKKILEIDKLKQILLTEDQMNLFEYIPDPLIPQEIFQDQFKSKINILELVKPYKFIFNEEKSDSLKIQLAFSSYMKIQKQLRQSMTDQQLIFQLDKQIIDLFHKFSNDSLKIKEMFPKIEYEQVALFSQRSNYESVQEFIPYK